MKFNVENRGRRKILFSKNIFPKSFFGLAIKDLKKKIIFSTNLKIFQILLLLKNLKKKIFWENLSLTPGRNLPFFNRFVEKNLGSNLFRDSKLLCSKVYSGKMKSCDDSDGSHRINACYYLLSDTVFLLWLEYLIPNAPFAGYLGQ